MPNDARHAASRDLAPHGRGRPAAGPSAARSEGDSKKPVTALGKLLRTTAFKLSLFYLTVFASFAALLLAYFAWNTSRLITEQITETIDAEINGLSEAYSQGGIRRLVLIIDARSRRPGSSLYLVTTPAGEGLAGNVGSLQPGILDRSGLTETSYRRLDEAEEARAQRAGARGAALWRLSPPGRPRPRRARAALRHHVLGRRAGRPRSSSCSGCSAASSSPAACSSAWTP